MGVPPCQQITNNLEWILLSLIKIISVISPDARSSRVDFALIGNFRDTMMGFLQTLRTEIFIKKARITIFQFFDFS